ncbi:50S ribosomal protein L32 [bacterium]|nr:50S ribosomal protein L32 [bacterium]
MATPKKRLTRSKRGKRRSHDALTATTVINCANCGSVVKPHHVCPSCGYYKGKEIVAAPQETAAKAT